MSLGVILWIHLDIFVFSILHHFNSYFRMKNINFTSPSSGILQLTRPLCHWPTGSPQFRLARFARTESLHPSFCYGDKQKLNNFGLKSNLRESHSVRYMPSLNPFEFASPSSLQVINPMSLFRYLLLPS